MTTTTADLVELITSIYRDALGDPSLDAESDFFEAGGDSLGAFQITAQIEATLEVEVPVALVFAYPSPADLASVVDAASGVAASENAVGGLT